MYGNSLTNRLAQRERRNRLYVPPWITRPISRVCEVRRNDGICGKPTTKAYPARGGGWMALCAEDGESHPEATGLDDLLQRGETLAAEH